MKHLRHELGGKPILAEDFLLLDEQARESATALLKDISDCILSGCVVAVSAVSGKYDVSAGYVWLGGKILPVAAVTAIDMPAVVVVSAPTDDFRTYKDAIARAVSTTYAAVIQASGVGIALSNSSRLDFWTILENKINYSDKATQAQVATLQAQIDAIGVPSAWIYVGSGGAAPAFQDTWSNESTWSSPVGFRRVSANRVTLRGVAKNTPDTTTWRLFQLPTGYRPAVNVNAGLRATAYGNSRELMTIVRIDADGWVELVDQGHLAANLGFLIMLDSLEFFTD